MSKNRILASIISNDTNKVKSTFTDSDSIVTSASLGVTAAAGTATYSSADTLPVSANDGDQALVTSTNRLYIYSGSGWYNIALVNNTPYWSTEAAGSYSLSKDSTPTVITILAVDSDGTQPVYTATADSDFNQIATLSRDSDNGRIFTITPIDSENGTAVSGTGTITFKASDGISLVSTLSTFDLSFITNITNSKHTTLLVKAAGGNLTNQLDGSSSPRVITAVGNVTSTAYTPYHPGGYSTYVDGTGDNITISNFAMAGDVTFEFWLYQGVAQSTSYRCVLGASTYASGIPFTLYTYSSNVQLWLSVGGSAEISGAFTAFTWHHIAMVRNSGTWTLYIDGVSAGTSTTGGSYDFAATTDWRFGENHGGSYDWKGYIRDARFVNGTAVYTSAFTPPTEPLTAITNTELLTCHLPYIADGSTNGHDIVLSNVTGVRTDRFSPYDFPGYTKADHGGSVYFDGGGDYFTTPTSADFAYGTGDFTIEAWVYVGTLQSGSGYKYILGQGTVSTGLGLYIQNGVYRLYGGGALIMGSSVSYRVNQWEHIAIARSGTTLKMFLNGAEVGSVTNSLNFASGTSNGLTIGRWVEAPDSASWLGSISDVRVVKGTAVYTSAFTPPTEPLTAISGTSLLTLNNKNDIWESVYPRLPGLPFSVLGSGSGATASNVERKFTPSSSIYFAGGSNNYLYKLLWQTPGTQDWTIEAWVYPTATTGSGVIQISTTSGTGLTNLGSAGSIGMGQQSGNWRMYSTGGWPVNSYVQSSTAVVINQWHHLAAVKTGGTAKLYLNGTEIVSRADAYDYSTTYYAAFGCANAANYVWPGYVQDLRITYGYARYTSNFTPATEEFEG